LNAAGTSLVFAELKTPVRQKMERYDLIDTINPDHFFDTIRERSTPSARRPGRSGPRARACSHGVEGRRGRKLLVVRPLHPNQGR
jgi:hypothetical protein